MQNTEVSLHFRPENGLPMPKPEAAWESPATLCFASIEVLKADATRQGIEVLLFDDLEGLFPKAAAGIAVFGADAEELVWELACGRSMEPENAEAWPLGFELLSFLTFWRLPLAEPGAYLEMQCPSQPAVG